MHFIIPEVIWQCQGWGPDSSPYIWYCNKQFYAYNKWQTLYKTKEWKYMATLSEIKAGTCARDRRVLQ